MGAGRLDLKRTIHFHLLIANICFFSLSGTVAPLTTLPVTASLNLSPTNNSLSLPDYRKCVNLPSWSDNRFDPFVCRQAFEYARSVESPHLNRKFEFLPNNEPPRTRYERMETPRRYNMGENSGSIGLSADTVVSMDMLTKHTTGGCTVAIVMLSFFNPQDLPGQPADRRRYDHSVTTFGRIFDAGRFVKECCVQYGRPPTPGWNYAGKSYQMLYAMTEYQYSHLLIFSR